MKTTIGHFTSQSNQSFPHDCELYEALQSNQFLAHIIGNIAGDKAILYGCELENGNARRKAGFVFVRTKAHPEGEVLYFEGGNVSSGMFVQTDPVSVSAQGREYPQAYTERYLKAGSGDESFKWSDFTNLMTLPELRKLVESQQSSITELEAPPVGLISMWPLASVPSNYLLCDGSQHRQADYPELYKILGSTYNSGPSYSGGTVTTTSGYFRVPDMRGRFPVGLSDVDSDYNAMRKVGGAKTVALTSSQMPSHVHSVNDYYYIENTTATGISGYETVSNTTGSAKTDTDNHRLLYKTHNTASTGGGSAHENRPPFLTMSFVIRAK